MDPRNAPPRLSMVGWREWISLPELGVARVKAKVDTGARTSSLHAFDVEILERRSGAITRFSVHPIQDDSHLTVQCEAPLLEQRWVKSSNGKREYRPVIRTPLHFAGQIFPIEVTLTSRDLMGFRMLLGREALRRRFSVDPGRSFLVKEFVPPKRKKKRPARALR